MHRVLVISHNSFSKIFNNGKTLESIFSQYNRENLAQLFFSQNEDPDVDFCSNYFKITDLDVLKNFILKNKKGEQLSFEKNSETPYSENTKSPITNFFKNSFNSSLLRDMLWSLGTWNTPKLYKWIEEFKPTLIFFMGGNLGFSHDIALNISEKYKLPLVTFFTDDYIIYPKYDFILDRIQKKRLLRIYKRTITASVLSFAIGDEMSKEYTSYFGKPFFPLMNSIDIDFPIYGLEKKPTKHFIIRYFGGLHLERWKMLNKIGSLINEINKEENSSIILEVYSASEVNAEMAAAFKKSNVLFKGKVIGKKFEDLLSSSDLLIHVESDNMRLKSLTRLSISTKIPEYLITGIPIVAYGPKELASIKLLFDNNLGLVIDTEESDAVIKNRLKEYIYNKIHTNKPEHDSRNFAIKNFDKNVISNKFKKRLEEIK